MVEIGVKGDRVVFEIEGLDKLWSLRSRLEMPLAHITDVEANADQVGRWWRPQCVKSRWRPTKTCWTSARASRPVSSPW